MNRELPIIFNTEMVRAILDGRKVCTRRPLRNIPSDYEWSGWVLESTDRKQEGKAGFKPKGSDEYVYSGGKYERPPYQKGDIQRVLTIAGTLSDGLLRKQKRVELAEKIKKFGSVPIETLANSVEIDPKELENLVYEMINEDMINAKIDVVEGRLTIVQLNNQDKTKEADKEAE